MSPTSPAVPTGAEVLAQNLRELTDVLRGLGPAVRRDAPDAVHQARTTTRRLRGLLALGAPLLVADTATVEAALAGLGTELGLARDAEVRVALIGDRLGRKKAKGLRKAAEKKHAKAVRHLHKRLDRGLLTDALQTLDDMPTDASKLGRRPAAEVWPDLLREAILLVREVSVGVASAHGREEHEERLHEVRKASRAVRYAAEAARHRGSVDDRRTKKLAAAAKQLQDVLGKWRDLLLLDQWISSQRGNSLRPPRGRMRKLRDEAAVLEATWPGALADLVVPDWKLERA